MIGNSLIYLSTTNGTEKKIDETKLANGEYKIGIIFASSKDGATFEGAPGSTLLIDEVELIYE